MHKYFSIFVAVMKNKKFDLNFCFETELSEILNTDEFHFHIIKFLCNMQIL